MSWWPCRLIEGAISSPAEPALVGALAANQWQWISRAAYGFDTWGRKFLRTVGITLRLLPIRF